MRAEIDRLGDGKIVLRGLRRLLAGARVELQAKLFNRGSPMSRRAPFRLIALLIWGLSALATLNPPAALAQKTAAKNKVDLALVVAVDISASMNYDEHELQRQGYIEAFRSKDLIKAITAGPSGRIAVTFIEWAGAAEPIQGVDWTIISNPKDANDFADKLRALPVLSERLTSISSAMENGLRLIETSNFAASRRVIDISGDGPNNIGLPVETARDEVIRHNIVINGLPIMLRKPMEWYDIEHLDHYYKQCVIGGPGAFIAPVFELHQLAATVRKKLVMEIANIEIEPGTAPIQFAEARPPAATSSTNRLLHRVQLKLPTEKMDCMIGEKAWNSRGGFGRFEGGGGPPPQRRRGRAQQ